MAKSINSEEEPFEDDRIILSCALDRDIIQYHFMSKLGLIDFYGGVLN